MNNIVVIACKLCEQILDIPADYIGVDKGALFLIDQEIKMVAAIGDFDSVNNEEYQLIQQTVPVVQKYDEEKDFSDLELAIRKAIELGYEHIIVTGALGGRIDHTYNACLLVEKYKNYDITFRDFENKVFILQPGVHMISKSHYKYFSFFPIFESKLSLIGFKYELFSKVIDRNYNIGLSNEIPGEFATIQLEYGLLICMQSKD